MRMVVPMKLMRSKRNGIKIATTIIFEEIKQGASFQRVMGMLDFALSFGAITQAERAALIQYLEERG